VNRAYSYEDSESNIATPRLVQKSESCAPDLMSAAIMKDGRSLEPVLIGYMYNGQLYMPFDDFFLLSAGLKWIIGIKQNSSMGAGSVRVPFSKSHRAPSRNMPLMKAPSFGCCAMALFSSDYDRPRHSTSVAPPLPTHLNLYYQARLPFNRIAIGALFFTGRGASDLSETWMSCGCWADRRRA